MKIDEDDQTDDPHELDALNSREAAFVARLLSGCTAQQSAIDAGYARSSAHNQAFRLLRRPRVAEAIAAAEADAAHQAGVTKTAVLQGLWAEANDRDNPPAVRVRARELVGRALQMFTERVELEQRVEFYSLTLGELPHANGDLHKLGAAEGVIADGYALDCGERPDAGEQPDMLDGPPPPLAELAEVSDVAVVVPEAPPKQIWTNASYYETREAKTGEQERYLGERGWVSW